mgnify:FL=1
MAFSPLCQLNGGCMGCCGFDFESKEKIKEAVFKNNVEFKHTNPKTAEEFIRFRDRRPSRDLRNGVCRNLIQEEGCYLCPLHPARHGKDLRIGHCDIEYLCKTATLFENWSEEKKKKFIAFIESKRLDNTEYSIRMDNDSLLKEFMELERSLTS